MKILQTFYKNKHILVTGGAGFIGSHIAERLVELGAHVSVLDDLSSGSINNINSFLHKIRLTVGDITNFDTCKKAVKNKDVIFHTAAFVSVPESIKHPAVSEKINVVGTYNILETYRKNNITKIIFSSSSAVYGERTNVCSENDGTNPQSPYAKHKLKGEELCKKFSEKYNINTACLRYFNVLVLLKTLDKSLGRKFTSREIIPS